MRIDSTKQNKPNKKITNVEETNVKESERLADLSKQARYIGRIPSSLPSIFKPMLYVWFGALLFTSGGGFEDAQAGPTGLIRFDEGKCYISARNPGISFLAAEI